MRMGQLASFLQEAFAQQPPLGWSCRREMRVLSSDLEQLLGYSPRADVCLETNDASHRIWIEFEISRADPVANHVKFATAHLFKAVRDLRHVCLDGQLSRCAWTTELGFEHGALTSSCWHSAFQTVLLPSVHRRRSSDSTFITR